MNGEGHMSARGGRRPGAHRLRPMLVHALLVLMVVSVAACTFAGQERTAAAANRAELVVRTLMSTWSSADTAVILDLFWPEATYDDFANQVTYQGLEEIVGYVTQVHDWGDDVYMSVGAVHANENGAVAEWVFSAVQNRPMGDRLPVATGREVVVNGVTIVEMRGNRIVRAADYMDTTPLLLQLGGRIELPGGVVVELEGVR